MQAVHCQEVLLGSSIFDH